MPILTAEQKATLAARLAEPDCAGLSDAAAAGVLNAPTTVPNPAPQPSVPRPITSTGLLGLLSDASVANLVGAALIAHLDDLIYAGARDRIRKWVDEFAAPKALVTAAEADAVRAALAAADPDPGWPATVPGPSWAASTFPDAEFPLPGGGTLSGAVTPEMVAEARS